MPLKNIVTLSLFAVSSMLSSIAHASTPADERAERIAKSSGHLMHNWRELQTEARRIADPQLARIFGALDHPSFKVLDTRAGAEAEIISQLRSQKLLDADFSGPLFLSTPPWPFWLRRGAPGRAPQLSGSWFTTRSPISRWGFRLLASTVTSIGCSWMRI